jgi:hypothetical protein
MTRSAVPCAHCAFVDSAVRHLLSGDIPRARVHLAQARLYRRLCVEGTVVR